MSDVVKQIEVSMEVLEKKIKKAECLERLSNNPDFKEYILEGFCKDHVLAMITKQVSPAYLDKTNQGYITGQIAAVGNLQLFMQFTRQEAAIAVESLKTAEEERATALEDEV